MTNSPRVLEVSDPVALRALAHPVRLQLLNLVRDHKPVTGARLAELAGESTASVSYHLSVLARHGFVEPDPVPGQTRRHKPWRTTFESMRITGSIESGVAPVQTPEGAVLATMLAQTRGQQDAYLAGTSGLPGQWQDVGAFSMNQLVLSAAELDRMAAEVVAVLDRYRVPPDGGDPAPDRARFAISFVAVPVPPVEPESAAS
jgi:DNA-binding transcriptional ArsR family regulator